MMSISHGLAKVEKLSLDELAPETMNSSTKRWGWISKKWPSCSRCNHIVIGMISLAGIAAAGGACASFPDPDDPPSCQAPLGTPSPARDFGVIFSLWVLVSLLGCRAIQKNTALPHIYEPQPEDRKKAVGKACSIFKLCHP